jgi:hypothetical protein
MIVLASLIPTVVLTVFILRTKNKIQNLKPIKVKAVNNNRDF